MSNEILAILEYMEKEKGIHRDELIAAIVNAIRGAAMKGVNAGQELRIEIDPKTGLLHAWAILEVVDSVSDSKRQIHLEKARLLNPTAELGNFVEKEMDPSHLGRIAAQTARQTIMQRLRQFEKERIYDDYKDQVGDIVSGTVRRRERGDLIIDLGKAEAILPPKERVPGEDYAPGERIRCLLLSIEPTSRGPELMLSRASVKFVRRLFELEVTEIADGTVTIEAISREPGYRTKMAVSSLDAKVDPVGACVGARGARVKSIVRELGGEKIDIVKFDPSPILFLQEAIKPAKPKNIRIEPGARRISFEVSADDLAVAIGRRGQNARLTSKLMGWKLDIAKEQHPEVGFEASRLEAVTKLTAVRGLSAEVAEFLIAKGITSLEAFDEVGAEDLVDFGFSPEDALKLLQLVQSHREAQR